MSEEDVKSSTFDIKRAFQYSGEGSVSRKAFLDRGLAFEDWLSHVQDEYYEKGFSDGYATASEIVE